MTITATLDISEKDKLNYLAHNYLSNTEEIEYLINCGLLFEAKAILLTSFDYLYEQGYLNDEDVCALYNELNLTLEERSKIRNYYYREWTFV